MKLSHCDGVTGDPVGRSPHGERGLKCWVFSQAEAERGRSPHGERGLKSLCLIFALIVAESLPPRGAWIEIRLSLL